MPKKWEIQLSEIILRTPGVRVRRDRVEMHSRKIVDDFYVFDIDEWSTIVPVTEDGRLLLVEQYRHALGKITLEFPAGLLEDPLEDPLAAAQRELREETGFSSDSWTSLGRFHLSPSKIVNAFHLFLAQNCRASGSQNLDETEDIRVVPVTPSEMDDLFETGGITDVDSCLAWLICRRRGLFAERD